MILSAGRCLSVELFKEVKYGKALKTLINQKVMIK